MTEGINLQIQGEQIPVINPKKSMPRHMVNF